jgi:hypothetical protein
MPPTHQPLRQVSLVVQASPSSHGAVLLVFVQPICASQTSSVHSSPSSQKSLRGVPPHTPPLHVSFTVQSTPSSQGAPFRFWEKQPDEESQRPSVQSPSR